MYTKLLGSIRERQWFGSGFIPLHAPVFAGNEKAYVLDAIDSTFVSSVGAYVDRMEAMLQDLTGAKRAVVCVNGTAALEMALRLAGVEAHDVVLTQALSFVATANAVAHIGAEPVFADIERATLGLSPEAVRIFFETHCRSENGKTVLKADGRRVAACVPMHSFGLPCRMDELLAVCGEWGVPVVEDAAEALGSTYKGRHCGALGLLGMLSFNGNKIITTGGGGAILTNDENLGKLGKHLTTTAKLPHRWEYRHDFAAWNFRLPNLNAALGCAQLEQLEHFLAIKRRRASVYAEIFQDTGWEFVKEPEHSRSNYWIGAVLTRNSEERDAFLTASNDNGLMTRPAWTPLQTLSMYRHCVCGDLTITTDIAERLVNLPSGVGHGFEKKS